ncbi:MAG: TonB-dependent receptor [Bacteroidales bacterium]
MYQNRLIFTLIIFIFSTQFITAQKQRTDANLVGHVVNTEGEHIPFASITVKGTTIGTITDETGHYQLINLPEGELKIEADCMGCKPDEVTINIKEGETREIKFELEEEEFDIQEVVVTGDRTGKAREDASVIVNSLKPKLFSATHSITLDESLNFSPGLRMENNCQNCGFSQVRMNGMEGPYSQILINSRPIFSGLAGVYGLELIPSNMIERVEVIRGGGSALYGSNAIAGTINLILKEPKNNFYEFGFSGNSIGLGYDKADNSAEDYTANFSTSVVSSDNKTGMALYGFYRDKDPFDANSDGYSELASINNITVGSRLFHRFGNRNKITLDFFHINEDRRGGDKHDYLPHMANIAEQVEHQISTGAITYDQFFNEKDLLSVYASGQNINRGSYYGAEQSLSDYGNTDNFTYTIGTQYTGHLNKSNFTIGIENKGEWLDDKKLGHPDIDNAELDFTDSTLHIQTMDNRTISDQTVNTTGAFAQYEVDWEKLQISVGGRLDHYSIDDKSKENADISDNVFSPRITLKYDISQSLQARTSYSQGYRAPQIYDEDLHIETSGARKVLHENAPDLTQETSHSYMASLDYNGQIGNYFASLLIEAFYTKLNDAFINEFGEPDENGTVVYTRQNAEDGAIVQGLNLEMNLLTNRDIEMKAGYTVQTSKYQTAHEFNSKDFFRTPDNYGYFTINWEPIDNVEINSSGNYTGKMHIPYFGPEIENPEEGELRRSNPFFDWDTKLTYNIRINGASLQVFGGMKNILNSYQNDFDTGIERDPGYIYGPKAPRTIYFGIKIGNKLKND